MGLVPTRPPPTPASVLVGTFVRRAHNVRGTMHALNSRQIELRNFFFDGGGIGKLMRERGERGGGGGEGRRTVEGGTRRTKREWKGA